MIPLNYTYRPPSDPTVSLTTAAKIKYHWNLFFFFAYNRQCCPERRLLFAVLIESSFTCLSFWVLLDTGVIFNRVGLVLAIIVIIEVSQLVDWWRSHFVYLDKFLSWTQLSDTHNKNVPGFFSILPSQVSKQLFLLHVDSDLAAFNNALKIHHTQQLEWHIFLFLPRDPQHLLALFFECYTFICTKQWLVFPWICDLIAANGWMHIPSFHLYCNEENYDRVKSLFAFEFHFGCLKLLFI